ncbi:MAG: CNNM domain-containing protein [Microthrixaceae bacterium]|nr:CNNM domain-containing protein [Microthrixaceae bacterium]
MTLALGLVAAALLIGANAFFVATEFALVAVDRTKLELLAEGGESAGQPPLLICCVMSRSTSRVRSWA